MSTGFDSLRAAEELKRAGIAETHANAIVATMSGAIGEHAATKSDITAVKSDIAAMKTDIRAMATDIAGLKTDVSGLKTDIAVVRTEVVELKAVLTWRIVLALGAFAALTRMVP